ncbi:MAG: N-acetylglucosaminyl-diphospho-decaprenol L-rhamnosyltransferase [Solirubrobacteraceae bacterium]|jgi:GT2 family glycosyltransferase|nr:N-acetylglucosaminyl-diphospho-decaprenol L-rhamnosyltransferase [Solirubrobacteraceae bacterium]
MTVAVVTVLHDSAADLRRLLPSLARWLPEARVIVVDSGSSDGGAASARAAGAEVIDLPSNPGFGAANNAGVAAVREDVTVLLNPDCELLDDGLAQLVARRAPALLVPRLVGDDGRVQRTAHPLPGTVGSLLPALLHPPLLPRGVRERVEPWRVDRARTVGWAIAACVVAPTAVLRALGPFDPGIFLFYEDLDLCLRARAVGVPTVTAPDVVVRHAGSHSTRAAYGGEPYALLAERRRAVVRAQRGPAAGAIDGLAQALTFATRWAARRTGGRDAAREWAQLCAQLAGRR